MFLQQYNAGLLRSQSGGEGGGRWFQVDTWAKYIGKYTVDGINKYLVEHRKVQWKNVKLSILVEK